MSNLFNKANTFYFVASSLATLTLLTSLALIVTSNLPPPLILALATLSVLVLALSYKIISNNKKIEVERNKFAQKEQELENKITLGKEAEEPANKEVEKLKHELTREKQNLDKRAKKLGQKVNESEGERESLLEEKKSLRQKLEAKANHIFEITDELKKVAKEKDELGKQEEELLHEITRLCEQLQEKENDIVKKEERITELKRKIDNNKHAELKNEELHKEIEKLSKEKEKLNKKINKPCKEKHILSNKKEELYKRQEELYAELDELQRKIKKIEKEKEKLSRELEEKFEELRDANDCINGQSFELDEIRKDCNNEVKSLKNLLLERDSQIKQLEEDLSKKEEKEVFRIERIIDYMICRLEGSIKRNKDIKNGDKKVMLQEILVMRSILEEVVQDLRNETPFSSLEDLVYALSPDETSVSSFEKDLGYESLPVSRSSTPTKPPDLLWTERCKRSQFRNVGLVKCDN